MRVLSADRPEDKEHLVDILTQKCFLYDSCIGDALDISEAALLISLAFMYAQGHSSSYFATVGDIENDFNSADDCEWAVIRSGFSMLEVRLPKSSNQFVESYGSISKTPCLIPVVLAELGCANTEALREYMSPEIRLGLGVLRLLRFYACSLYSIVKINMLGARLQDSAYLQLADKLGDACAVFKGTLATLLQIRTSRKVDVLVTTLNVWPYIPRSFF